MIDVSDDGHVTDVPLLVHHATDFVDSKIHLQMEKFIVGLVKFGVKVKKKLLRVTNHLSYCTKIVNQNEKDEVNKKSSTIFNYS